MSVKHERSIDAALPDNVSAATLPNKNIQNWCLTATFAVKQCEDKGETLALRQRFFILISGGCSGSSRTEAVAFRSEAVAQHLSPATA